MQSSLLLRFPGILGDWESDKKKHKAYVVQRVRPPCPADAELVGLMRIRDSEITRSEAERPFEDDIEQYRFIEGQGTYIREYFEAAITPLLAEANFNFKPDTSEVGRTDSNVSYILEKANEHAVSKEILKIHSVLYDALAAASEYKDLCLDFVVVQGEAFYNIAPNFFNNLLVAYRFPFGIVLLHKCHHPVVLVIVTYSMRNKMRMFGSAGAGEPLHLPPPPVRRPPCPSPREKKRRNNNSGGRHAGANAMKKCATPPPPMTPRTPPTQTQTLTPDRPCSRSSEMSSESTRRDALSEIFTNKMRDPEPDSERGNMTQ